MCFLSTQAYIRGAGRARPIHHWRVHVALSYFRAAAILHGVWARAMQVCVCVCS